MFFRFLVILLFFNIELGASQSVIAGCVSSNKLKFDPSSLDSRFVTGFVKVKEEAGESKLSSSEVSVYYFYRPVEKPSSEPIVFFNGGPGQDSHQMLKAFSVLEELKNIPLVFIDQRGTGCSSKYPDLKAGNVNRALNWGSRAIAADAEAVRKKLFGDQAWKIFGYSYGGLIASRYFELYPQSVSSMTIYGYSPANDPVNWLYQQTIFIEQQTKAYLKLYPNDKKIILELKKHVKGACLSVREYQICGAGIIDTLGQFLAFKTSWGELHSWVVRLKRALLDSSSPAREEQIMIKLSRHVFEALTSEGEALVPNAISNFEIVPGMTPHEAFSKVEKRIKDKNIDRTQWLLDPIEYMKALDLGGRNKIFANLKSDPLTINSLNKTIRKNLHVDVSFFNGGRDGIQPPNSFYRLQNLIADAANIETIPDIGHNSYVNSKVIESLRTKTEFDLSVCNFTKVKKFESLIEEKLTPWLEKRTQYDVRSDKIGRPVICPVSKKQLVKIVFDTDDEDLDLFGFFRMSGAKNGVLLLVEDSDLKQVVRQEAVLHEFIHFVQLKNKKYESYRCIYQGEYEAYMLGGRFFVDHKVRDPFVMRGMTAVRRSRCPRY